MKKIKLGAVEMLCLSWLQCAENYKIRMGKCVYNIAEIKSGLKCNMLEENVFEHRNCTILMNFS